MAANRARLRTDLFSIAARFLQGIGLVTLARPIVNGTRLRVDASGRPVFPYLRFRKVRNAQILIYHRVNDELDPYFGGVPTAVFESQMAYLASHFQVLPLPDLIQRLRDRTLPDNALAVTFDDGYRDNYLHAFPILQRHGIPATIFLVTSVIGSDRALWHDDVFSAFRETIVPRLEAFGPKAIRGPLGTVVERLRVQRALLADLRARNDEDRTATIAALRDALGVGASRKVPGLMLGWDDVRVMSAAGIEFGSHTVTHSILSRADPVRARLEIVESKRVIEERLGIRVDSFAYPNGSRADFLPETKALLREAGYSYAVTTVPGSNEPEQDVFELRRATPWETDPFAFGIKLHYNKLLS